MDTNIIYLKSSHNRININKSDICGCFYCLKIFKPSKIKKYIYEAGYLHGCNESAICPYCKVDSVLPDIFDYDIDRELLKEMYAIYFTNIETTKSMVIC